MPTDWLLPQEFHSRARRPDSELIVHWTVPQLYKLYNINTLSELILYQSWVYIILVPHGYMPFVYKPLYPYVAREVLMKVAMNFLYVCSLFYLFKPWRLLTGVGLLQC